VTVVGDKHQTAPISRQFTLQPLDAVDVEMVGGLIEYQQVGVGDQSPGEGDPLLLTSREAVGGLVEYRAEPQPVERGLSTPPGPHRLPHGTERQGGDLVEGGDADPTAAPHRSRLRFTGAGHHRQQGGLARAVDAHHPESVTSGYGDADVGEEGTVRSAHTDAVDVGKDHVAQTTSQIPGTTHPLLHALHRRTPWEPGPTTRALGLISSRVRTMAATVHPLEHLWHSIAAEAVAGTLPLWIVLGDSTGQGVGATSLDHSWVARVSAAMTRHGRSHGVVNLSRSGARSADVIDEQLPLLDLLPQRPAIVSVTVGTNDLIRNPHAPALARRMRHLIAELPAGSIIATLPAPPVSPSSRVVNKAIRQAVEAAGHRVAEIGHHLLGPRQGLSHDRFHPSDAGYGAWVKGFCPPMGVDSDSVPEMGTLGREHT